MPESTSSKTMSAPSGGNSPANAPASPSANPEVDEQMQLEEGGDQIEDAPFPVKIVLPHGEEPFELPVSPLEQIHEIRQSIIEHPIAIQYSCFHLEHNGERINDFAQVSEVNDLAAGSELRLIEDPYTEKEARIHMIRIRELIGAAGDRTDTVHGILAGLSIHDSLVFEPTKTTESAEKTTEAEVKEYDFQAPSSLKTLLPRNSKVAPKTVKSIALSPWNPPPAHLRQRGHLLYITASTLDGDHHITAHVGGFFVNKCTNQKFDPFPKTVPKEQSAHSLFSLIELLSPKFAPTFQDFQDFQSLRDPLSTFQIGNAFPSAPWIVPSSTSPLCAHITDPARSQETYLLSGAENTDSLRDWNEEFQSAKELPRDTIQDRVFRERLLSKLYADYNDAATRGAVLVARGEVAPLNPTEARDAQIFVYNNVFFSFGADGVGTFTSEGGNEAAKVATGKDVLGVKLVNQLDIDGLYTPGTVVVDYLGKRIVGQSIVPGIFKQPEPGENQIHYGAVDGKDVVAADERFVPVFEKLAKALRVKKHSVWDKDGKKFDLEASVEMKGLLGTDGRKYVLDLYRITPLDKLWMEEDASEEDAKYPHRMTVLRPELVENLGKVKARDYINAELKSRGLSKEKDEANGVADKIEEKAEDEATKTEPAENAETNGDKPEAEAEAKTEAEEEKEKVEEAKPERVDMSGFDFSLNPDAFSDQKPETDAEKEELAKDEEAVLAACKYLRDDVIPTLLHELRESDISFPMDGRSLTRQLHRRGINLRYLGKLAQDSSEERLHCFRDVCVREMIARSFKHVAAKYLKELPLPLTSACFAHLLNCLLGYSLNPNPVAEIDESLKTLFKDTELAFAEVTPESLRAAIELETARRYRFTLADGWWAQIGHLQMLREISLKLGLQLQVKEFAFAAESETTSNGAEDAEAKKETESKPVTEAKGKNKKKKKAAAVRDGSPASISSSVSVPHTFSPDDFVNVVPIIKDSCPRSALAEEALEAGRLSIFQGQRKLGEDLLLESLSLHEQIYGLLHPEVAQMYHTLSQLYYQMGQKEAAVELAKKAVIVSERTVGLDSAETVLNYLNLSLFLHQLGKSKEALLYAKHALDLWKIIYGRDHPDTITTMNNYAVMLQSIQAYHESRRWFEESLRVCETVFGKDTVHSATLLFQLAQALALDGLAKDAVDKMRDSRNIFLRILGPEDKNTIEAGHWLDQLTTNAVHHLKQDKIKGAAKSFRFSTMGASAAADTRDATGKKAPVSTIEDSRSVDELVKFVEGSPTKGGNKKRGPRNPKKRSGASGTA